MYIHPKKKEDQILVISGAGGSGKSTTCSLLAKLYPEIYEYVPFYVTRDLRASEVNKGIAKKIDVESMFQEVELGNFATPKVVIAGAHSAINLKGIREALYEKKIALLEFPLNEVYKLEEVFPHANITVTELVSPHEIERLRRLKEDGKFTEERVHNGLVRLAGYKSGELLNAKDHDLVLMTETNQQENVAKNIHKFMQVQCMTAEQLLYIEKQGGEKAVRKLLKHIEIGSPKSLKTDPNVDREFFVDLLHL